MEEERLMLHATLLTSAHDRAPSDLCSRLLRPLGHLFPRFRAATLPSVYVPPVAFDWLTKLEAKEAALRAKGDRLVAIIRSQLLTVTTAATYGINVSSNGYELVSSLSDHYPSSVRWALLTIGILTLLVYIFLFRIYHGLYTRGFSRPISDFLREGDTLLDQTVSIRDYVGRTPISSVALSSPVDDIARFDARIETLITCFRGDVRSLRRHRMWYVIVLVGVCVMGFMLGIVGPWWMYVRAEESFGH